MGESDRGRRCTDWEGTSDFVMVSAENLVLRSTVTSPIGRKARIAIDALGLAGRVTIAPADPLDGSDALRRQNPLGKMPCLVLADESPIYDSSWSSSSCEMPRPLTACCRYAVMHASRPLRWRGLRMALWMHRFSSYTRTASVLIRRPQRAGSITSAARSCAGWLIRPRLPPGKNQTLFRSVFPAHSVILTGASRSIGGRPFQALSRGWTDFRTRAGI